MAGNNWNHPSLRLQPRSRLRAPHVRSAWQVPRQDAHSRHATTKTGHQRASATLRSNTGPRISSRSPFRVTNLPLQKQEAGTRDIERCSPVANTHTSRVRHHNRHFQLFARAAPRLAAGLHIATRERAHSLTHDRPATPPPIRPPSPSGSARKTSRPKPLAPRVCRLPACRPSHVH